MPMTPMGENNVGYVKSAVSSSSASSSDSESEEDERQKELRKGRIYVCQTQYELEREISLNSRLYYQSQKWSGCVDLTTATLARHGSFNQMRTLWGVN